MDLYAAHLLILHFLLRIQLRERVLPINGKHHQTELHGVMFLQAAHLLLIQPRNLQARTTG